MPSQVVDVPLRRGQVQWLDVRQGSTLVVQQGDAIVLGPMQWLAERAVLPRQHLRAGQALCMAQSGWVQVQAVQDGAAQLHSPAPRRWRACLAACMKKARAVAGSMKRL